MKREYKSGIIAFCILSLIILFANKESFLNYFKYLFSVFFILYILSVYFCSKYMRLFLSLEKRREKLSHWLKKNTTIDFSDWGVFVLFILGLFAMFFFSKGISLLDLIPSIVLWFTAIVVMQYTKETYWLKNISQKDLKHKREQGLRPIILRGGYFTDWGSVNFGIKNGRLVSGTPLSFTIFKQIATDINGYIVIDGYRYLLLFANKITEVEHNKFIFMPKWGWMKPNARIYAIYDKKDKEKVGEENKIYINYNDVEGNGYYTVEDKNFSQKSFSKK